MKISFRLVFAIFGISIFLVGCASKRRKAKEPSALGKFYHNTTALYNGYFNANEIIKETYLQLEAAHQDNFTEILPLYDYTHVADTKTYEPELERAIEKVTTVAMIHEPSHWVDDCYVLMGEAQFLKQDFESAEETFEYFKEEFSPTNPFGRNYQKKKVSKKALKKEREEERKEKEKAKEEEREQKKKDREAEKKAREKEKKEQKKAREEERKRRAKEKKERAKANKKKRKSGGKKKRPAKEPVEKVVEEEVPSDVKVETPAPVKTTPADRERTEETEAEQEQEVADVEKEEKKKKKDETAYSKGMMWLARTYVERDKLSTAKYMVRRMQNEGGLPNDVERELPVILADIYIKENNYPEAILQLDEAIEKSNKKKRKARYAYVAGQLSQAQSNEAAAGEYFAKAKKWTNNFRMEFMAELNAEKSKMIGGGKSKEAVINKLDNMAKEAKYAEYLDQIYFTKGEILLEDNKFADALTSFRTSIRNNNGNLPLKVETYYKLANLFYDKEEYVDAKYHYDSTLQVIDKEDPRYAKTKRYSENLTDIAALITAIDLQDSLLMLAKLDDAQLRKLAEKLVEKGIKAERAATLAPQRESKLLTGSPSRTFTRSNFWAYNQQTRTRHAEDFKSIWGNIELQDDWRRSDKQSVFGGDDPDVVAEVSEEEKKLKAVDATMVDIKKQLPYSPQQKADALAIVSSSLFELGKLYRDNLANYGKAIATHEELLRRFDVPDKELDTYYYLYLSNLEKPDQPRADFYKQKILSKYPDTDYARVISDPAYAASLNSEERKLEEYYRDTYAAFEEGDYQLAYNNSKDTEKKFGSDNALQPKFHLLSAMSLGSIQGKDVYVKALRDVIAKHPNTPEKARAEEIMRFIQGDAAAFDNTDMKEVDDIFSEEDNLKHYIAIVTFNMVPETFDKALIQVSEYNKEQHEDKRLQLSDSNLNKDENTDIILVRKFKNKAEAMEYYNDIIKAGNDFIENSLGGYAIYAITQRNYRKMVIERSDSRYRLFFNKYYLEK